MQLTHFLSGHEAATATAPAAATTTAAQTKHTLRRTQKVETPAYLQNLQIITLVKNSKKKVREAFYALIVASFITVPNKMIVGMPDSGSVLIFSGQKFKAFVLFFRSLVILFIMGLQNAVKNVLVFQNSTILVLSYFIRGELYVTP